jgi:hypothetical protein
LNQSEASQEIEPVMKLCKPRTELPHMKLGIMFLFLFQHRFPSAEAPGRNIHLIHSTSKQGTRRSSASLLGPPISPSLVHTLSFFFRSSFVGSWFSIGHRVCRSSSCHRRSAVKNVSVCVPSSVFNEIVQLTFFLSAANLFFFV